MIRNRQNKLANKWSNDNDDVYVDHAIDKENISVTPPQYRHQIVGILGAIASTI